MYPIEEGKKKMKIRINITIIKIVAVLIFYAGTSFGYTGNVYIENVQVAGSVFSFELHFMRTDEWTPGLIANALGGCDASFDFNTDALTNPTLVVEPGGPLDNANYPNTTVQIIIDKLIVDIPFATNALAGTIPLNVDAKLLTVYMDITDPNQTAQLSWDALNTGFFDSADSTIMTTLIGENNDPLPIELTVFSAEFRNQTVELSWETKTEIKNYGFSIERRTSEGDWNSIAFIDGAGYSNSTKKYVYKDNDLFSSSGSSKFQYRLKQIDTDGKFTYSDVVNVKITPSSYKLFQNFPNPFNPTTTIRYQLPKDSRVSLNVYDILGREVATLVNKEQDAGRYSIQLSASAYRLASGIYIYRIQAGNYVSVKKLMLMK